MGVDQRKTNYS